jgi:hypothetical protein
LLTFEPSNDEFDAEIFRKHKARDERRRECTQVHDRLSEERNAVIAEKIKSKDCLGLYGQVNKRIRWMPRRQEAMKDVIICDKPRGADKYALIRGFPNGETQLPLVVICN